MKKLREDMQIIFQDPFASINPRMTVSQTIAEPLLIQGKYKPGDKEALNRHVRQVMDRVGLAQRLVNAYPHELGRRPPAENRHRSCACTRAEVHCL